MLHSTHHPSPPEKAPLSKEQHLKPGSQGCQPESERGTSTNVWELTSELSQQLWLSTGHLCLWKSTQQIQEPLAGAEGRWVQDILYIPLYGPKLSATPAASPQHCSQAWTGCCGCSWKPPPVKHKPINAAVCSGASVTALILETRVFPTALGRPQGWSSPSRSGWVICREALCP